MVSVATGSFLHGMLKARNLDLKCFLMGNLVPLRGVLKSLLDGISIDYCQWLWVADHSSGLK